MVIHINARNCPLAHADGRAGMAALVVGADFELREFRAHLAAALPTYARPQFLRIVRAIELTGTLKLDKQALAREGYDNSVVSDPLFVEDKQAQSYVPLDDASFARLQNGSLIL